jgi:enamine deaminase RidA (YjgF/YER057c/UK114 family)
MPDQASHEHGQVEYLNPDGLPTNPAYTQAVAVTGPVRTVYIGMQNSVDGDRNIIGKGDIAAQTEQTLKNIDLCLAAAGAGPEHVIMLTVYIVQGQSLQDGFAAAMRWWGNRPNPPTNNVVFVSAIVSDFLVGISAIAVVPL